MKSDKITLLVNALESELEEAVSFARSEGLGVEVTAFASAAMLDSGMEGQIGKHAKALKGVATIVSHGPFQDLSVTSRDPAIREVCKKRHEQALKASKEVGACMYVAHTNYTPFILSPAYRKNYAARMCEFWLPLADTAGKDGITIVLENLWEGDPSIQKELVERAAHPRLKASFDNGHALVFSKVPSADWVKELGDDLSHVHLHDNDGKADSHLAVGEGKEDWPTLLKALATHAPRAFVVSESDRLERNRASIAVLRRLLADAA